LIEGAMTKALGLTGIWSFSPVELRRLVVARPHEKVQRVERWREIACAMICDVTGCGHSRDDVLLATGRRVEQAASVRAAEAAAQAQQYRQYAERLAAEAAARHCSKTP
jgi:antirestriction protein ArdC